MLSADDRSAIEALHETWLDAERRGDSPALLQLCAAVPVWLPPNEAPLCGKTEILRWLERQPPALVQRIEIDDVEISGVESLAWKLASFRTTLTDAGGAKAIVVTGSHGWLLQRDDDGVWRVAVVTWRITGP
jgi:ketosteroid isomerase-like protein